MSTSEIIVQTFYDEIDERECVRLSKATCKRLNISLQQVSFMAACGMTLPYDEILKQIRIMYGERVYKRLLIKVAAKCN